MPSQDRLSPEQLLLKDALGQSHATPPGPPRPPRRPRRKPASPDRTMPRLKVRPRLDAYAQALSEWLEQGCGEAEWEALLGRRDEPGAPPWLNGEVLGLDPLSHRILGMVMGHMIRTTLGGGESPLSSEEEISGRCLLRNLDLPQPQGIWDLAQRLYPGGPLRTKGYLVSDLDAELRMGEEHSSLNLSRLLQADFSLNITTLGLLLGTTPPVEAAKLPSLEELVLPDQVRRVLTRLLAAPPLDRPFKILLEGPEGSGRRSLAQAIASQLKRPFRLVRPMAARQPGVVLAVELVRGFDDDDWRRVSAHPGWLFILRNGEGPYFDPVNLCDLVLDLRNPSAEAMEALAERTLRSVGSVVGSVPAQELGALNVTPGVLVKAIHQVDALAKWDELDAGSATAKIKELMAPASARNSGDPPREVVNPRRSLRELCLPPETRERFQQVIEAIQGRGPMLKEWNIDVDLVGKAQGVALFHGPSGTGKSLGAEVLAHELGLPLWRMEASELESPFVGESESRLHAFFSRSKGEKCVLLLDEADSVLTDRRLAEGSTRRYITSLTNAWLRELDRFEGILVLTSNNASSMDPAVERRIMWRIPFEAPGPDVRVQIWQSLFGNSTIPGREDLDLPAVARQPLTGGRIRNAFLSACQKAAAHGGMTQELLMAACLEEVKSGITGQDSHRTCGFGASLRS